MFNPFWRNLLALTLILLSISISNSFVVPYIYQRASGRARLNLSHQGYFKDKVLDDINQRNSNAFVISLKNLASREGKGISSWIVSDFVTQNINSFTPSDVSNILWSLPRIGFSSSKKTDQETAFLLLNKILENQSTCSRFLVTSLVGLSKLGIRWSTISALNPSSFFNLLNSVMGTINGRELSNLLYSLAKMEIRAIDFPVNVLKNIIAAIDRELDFVLSVPQQAANVLYALGILEFDQKMFHSKSLLLKLFDGMVAGELKYFPPSDYFGQHVRINFELSLIVNSCMIVNFCLLLDVVCVYVLCPLFRLPILS